jgi:hypothetical protein
MITNRSMPPGVIIPELPYYDVNQAATWLCQAFGFRERLRIGNHRWTFSQTIADVDPATWAGILVQIGRFFVIL